jgi:RND family efflux transporter MFP subunit
MTRASRTLLLLGLAALAACSSGEPKAKAGRGGGRKLEYPVDVAPLEKRAMRYTVTAPGSIEAFQQVQITARVSGAVDKVAFAEGEQVAAGQVLVNIESDRFQVALDLAKAQLAKAQAAAQQTQDQLARRQAAAKDHPGIIPGEELATFQTAVTTAKADVASAEQSVRVAQINLRDSSVRAPIAGVVQTRTVQLGQYLQTGTVLATLLQRDPLLLRFSVSEQDAPRLKPGMPATLRLKESAHIYSATLTLVAGAADPETRLVPVTATLDPTDHPYWLRPGAFCEVSVPVGNAREAIVVPNLAIQPTEDGNVAYVVDGTAARPRKVELGMHTSTGDVEVTRGLQPGELLVVRGIESLSDGAPVKIVSRTTLNALDADGGAPPEAGGPPSGGLSVAAQPGDAGGAP